MSLFNMFKKKNPVSDYLDGFFNNLEIVDVVIAPDIPVISVDGGDKQEASADTYFRDHERIPPYCIDKFVQDNDAIFWVFETFFVFEFNATKRKDKIFVVMELVDSTHNKHDHLELGSRLYAMEVTIKITGLRQLIHNDPIFEALTFRHAWEFFVNNENKVNVILQRKYS